MQPTPCWHACGALDVVAAVGSDPERGLGSDEVRARLAQHGRNRIEPRGAAPWWRVLARQYADVLIAILAAAAAVSLAIGDAVDAAAIAAILLLNGLLGFLQEWRAEREIAALAQMLVRRCAVVRDGREREIDAEEVVPGDIVALVAGDRVPADLRLVEAVEFAVDESPLTGESLAVEKGAAPVPAERTLAERASMLWMGTAVTNGVARGVVVATGERTEFGRIAALTRSVERDPTPLQRRLARLGRQLGAFALVTSALVALAGWWLGRDALEMFLTGVSLAVAVVPEGLPAAVTITLALGVRQMVRRRALPRRLQAIETLGSASVILTDKTGTLTENQMTVVRLWLPAGEVLVSGTGYRPTGGFTDEAGAAIEPAARGDLGAALATAAACNRASLEHGEDGWRPVGEATEAALVVAAHKAGISAPPGRPLLELPFDSGRKRMATVRAADGGLVVHTKGAPEVLLERCTRVLDGMDERELTPADRERAQEAYLRLARSGLRTLAVAHRSLDALPGDPGAIEAELVLLGIFGIHDPPRPAVPEAVARARSAGVRAIMITGDAPETARAIALEIGLPVDRVLGGAELDRLDDDALSRILRGAPVIARASPEQKLRIARLLERAGEVVAMTGDGVNDAPALKEADIGIAMGMRGTDVAREAADLVLTDDNFATIVNAIEEGRREDDNIKKFVRYLLSSNVGETVAIFLCIVLRAPLVLLPVQILWINVVTDAVTAMSLGLEPPEGDLMRRLPRRRDEPILSRAALGWVLAIGSYIGLATLALFLLDLRGGPLIHAQTLAFTAMVVLEQVNLFNHRALRTPLVRAGFFTNPWLLVALFATVVLQLAATYVPVLQQALHTTALGWRDWAIVLAVAAPLFLVPETIKSLRFRARSEAGRHAA